MLLTPDILQSDRPVWIHHYIKHTSMHHLKGHPAAKASEYEGLACTLHIIAYSDVVSSSLLQKVLRFS